MKISVLLTGRAYPTDDKFPESLELAADATVASAIAQLQEVSVDLTLPKSCLIAVSGKHLGSLGNFRDQPLREGDELTLVAPVAGG